MAEKIKVSVICVTYNHEKYIRQALDSILMQKTEFPFEIRIGEDCSTDSTREILKEYEQKYPGRFCMYYREQNLGATKNEYELLMDAEGDYIAALELDDLWTDEYKLQKQYDFLEKHREYIGVSHNFDTIDKEGKVLPQFEDPILKSYLNHPFTLEDFLSHGFVFQTGTHFYRNIFKDGKDYSIIYKADKLIRDKTILSLLLDRGDFFILEDNMSAYRRFFDKDAQNGRNLTNSNLELDLYTKAEHVEALHHYFDGRIDYSEQWTDIVYGYLKHLLRGEHQYSLSRFLHMYQHSSKKTRKNIRKEFCGSIFRKLRH
ncbi:MAG: glycosyltransferase family 2 protein [Lachnospiraceae bacterium]|nr:glycosyltransferase family 2 protein [Lachnospiraceae bacterium]